MKFFRRSRAAYSVVSGPIWLKSEKRWGHRLTLYKSMGAVCCHGNQSFDPICPKTLCSLPSPNSGWPLSGKSQGNLIFLQGQGGRSQEILQIGEGNFRYQGKVRDFISWAQQYLGCSTLKGKAILKENIIKMKDILFPKILVQVS